MNRPLLAILIVSALLLNGARSANPRDGNQGRQTRTEAQNKNTPSDPVAASSHQPNPNPAADYRNAETYNYYGNFNYVPQNTPARESFWTAHSAAITGISAILVAIFTGALVVTSYRQWNVAKESADAAKKSADAAIQANQTTREALVVTERAYVVVYFRDDSTINVSPGQKALFKIAIENQGHTPAYRLKIKAWIVPATWPDTTEQELLDLEKELPLREESETTLFPNVKNFNFFDETGAPLDANVVAAIMDGTKWRLFIWGTATYETFDKSRFTNFCFTFGGRSTNNGAVVAPFHNDAT